jgi:hypothetical protein
MDCVTLGRKMTRHARACATSLPRAPAGDPRPCHPSPHRVGCTRAARGRAAARVTSASAGTRPDLHGLLGGKCSCMSHRPNASGTLGGMPPRRTQPGRTTARLRRHTDQGAKRNFLGDLSLTSETPVPQSSYQESLGSSPNGGAAAQTAAGLTSEVQQDHKGCLSGLSTRA